MASLAQEEEGTPMGGADSDTRVPQAETELLFTPDSREADDVTYGWDEVCETLRAGDKDVRRMLFHDLFVNKYNVVSSVDALVHAPHFIEEYIVSDLDYRAFAEASGLMDEGSSEIDFGLYERQNLLEDMGVGVSYMLEMAMVVARKMEIPVNDVMATMPNGSAVRVIPKCAALARWLPGALCTARALKAGLPTSYDGPDPFANDEDGASSHAGDAFAERYHCAWVDLEVAMSQDKKVKSCCRGTMRVSFSSGADDVSIISLVPVNISSTAPRESVPLTAFTDVGPDVLLEVEAELGNKLEEGITIDADWYELENGPWLMTNVASLNSGISIPSDEELEELDAQGQDVPEEDLAAASTAASDPNS